MKRCILLFLTALVLCLGCTATAAQLSYDGYKQVLLDVYEEFDDGSAGAEYLWYSLYDIDGDGVQELIVLAGTCEADYVRRIYTIVDDEARYVGETFGGHSTIYACPDGGFYNMMAHMGYQEIYKVTYVDGAIVEEFVLCLEIAEEEEYYTPGELIEHADITDFSLVEEGAI